ncbi:peptide-methionine (S)-S-oxide reductase MsrA [Roseibium salinum]|uniref:Peptide methionine sulfoxide reductase MsrA n=1 Tax=Roseibium salinum TaxID=1604349 RepID=A0ABT3R586_9HYPH|nr:peptide-methionine (S)-S-oxide reductase MsrA [Roseibium sp. DSM 29163]MCX2724211.1 peptide-methionine (S)-S-oxide reductase MsrA [Roseibium sp. DSM 29163]
MSFMTMLTKKFKLPSEDEALPGRDAAITPTEPHFVNGRSLTGPYPANTKSVLFGMGCFWGAERLFWQLPGVHVTAVGYAGGHTPNPTYHETCTGRTGHTEAVLVVYDPDQIAFADLLKVFWESHDPTQGMRQGNDTGTQYRSAIYVSSAEDLEVAERSRDAYQHALKQAGKTASITTEIRQLDTFYFAEDYHQQYLAKNPAGYCGIGGTGVACPTGLGQSA